MTGRELVALDLKGIKEYVEGITNFLHVESLGLRQISRNIFRKVIKFPLFQNIHIPFSNPGIYTATITTAEGELSITYEAKTVKDRLKMSVRGIKRLSKDMKLLEEL